MKTRTLLWILPFSYLSALVTGYLQPDRLVPGCLFAGLTTTLVLFVFFLRTKEAPPEAPPRFQASVANASVFLALTVAFNFAISGVAGAVLTGSLQNLYYGFVGAWEFMFSEYLVGIVLVGIATGVLGSWSTWGTKVANTLVIALLFPMVDIPTGTVEYLLQEHSGLGSGAITVYAGTLNCVFSGLVLALVVKLLASGTPDPQPGRMVWVSYGGLLFFFATATSTLAGQLAKDPWATLPPLIGLLFLLVASYQFFSRLVKGAPLQGR